MTAPLMRTARRVIMALGIGRQTADTNETPNTPTVQVALAAGELRSDVPVMQEYGLASRPVPGSDLLVAFIGGDRTRGVVIATGDQRGRPKDLQPGEVCLFHPSTGSRIWLKADGSIALVPSNGKTAVTGDLTASGTITGNEVVAQGVKLSSHPHTGVTAGSGDSGPPVAS
ncbi:phage baseplate assembly protein [Gluconacetobacter entanii]|uniref:phage baseplate assembly protein domain-containing protein n=1 Tax=Gluconacetobacter entanii TaxID=108528 RepID=UPI001C932A8C|nr:phage baseplate assembly protein [Gluconacetobacter entanii]MBY4641567.1 phage baseplate assembly protein [Gluconacetobacter entanii]MCW4582034.1 phage baseplate assembly protein [Gluconacetobacter entanii]MCW4585224.1 phage baseplate assembly protein [Gluconacetobacter entanii]MCW4588801.1 phage baseplate assembly protein [Gluconacetobacter entanii]